MSLTVEDGTGLPNSESYVSVSGCSSYCALQGIPFEISVTANAEAALRRATQFIDFTFRQRFPGTRTKRRAQALEWPRIGAYYYSPDDVTTLPYYFYQPDTYASYPYWPYDVIDQTTLPVEVVNATCQAASFEISTPGVLLTGGLTGSAASLQSLIETQLASQIIAVKAGNHEIRFSPASTSKTSTSSSSSSALDLAAITPLKAGLIMIEVTLAPLIHVPEFTARAARA